MKAAGPGPGSPAGDDLALALSALHFCPPLPSTGDNQLYQGFQKRQVSWGNLTCDRDPKTSHLNVIPDELLYMLK